MEKPFIALKKGETFYETKRFLPFTAKILYVKNSCNPIDIFNKELWSNNMILSRTIIATSIALLKEMFFKDIARHNKTARKYNIKDIIHF